MIRSGALCAVVLLLCSCGGNSAGAPLAPPVTSGGGHQPGPISITEINVPVNPLYVGADSGGAYFGFGSSGTGSDLFYYSGTATSSTAPAAGTNGYNSSGGVYGIFVAANANVYWLSAYFGNSAQPSIQVECGAPTPPTLCSPYVDEPTAVATDVQNTLWVSGLTYAGGGEIRTSAQQSYDSDTFGVISLINGPSASIWGILQSPTFSPGDQIVQFAASGSTISVAHTYALAVGSHAGALTMGGDGHIWFTDFGKSAIGTITAKGAIREFFAPHMVVRPSYAQPDIVTDCDGAMWFPEANADSVARIQTDGSIREIQLPTPNSYPAAIATAPHTSGTCTRVIWVGEARSQRLAQVTY